MLKIAGNVSPAMLRKVYAHVRDEAVRKAIDGLSRAEGWKPSERALRKMLPKHVERAKVKNIARQSKQVIKESAPEDDSWIRLAGEAS